jgi:hypothetical protein
MERDQDAIIDEIDKTNDHLHAKWWELACWLTDHRGIDSSTLTPQARIEYAAEIRELTDNWEMADVSSPEGKPLSATTELQGLLAEYYELTEQLSALYEELEESDGSED